MVGFQDSNRIHGALACRRLGWVRTVPRRARSLVAVAALALGFGCSRDAEIVERPVVVYSPRACPVAESDAYSVIYGGGDFEPSPERPPIARAFLRELGRSMPDLPPATRSLVVDISQREKAWRGLADVPPSGEIHVLVWPRRESCRLTRDVERREAMTFGVFGHHFMVAGGRARDGAQVPHTYVGDLTTGAIERLPIGMNTRRASPSITEFRAPGDAPGASSALVAGGHDPDSGIADVPPRAIATAEVYVPRKGAAGDVGDFAEQRIDLSEPRTRHGAVVLATGETLLVGGRGPAGPLRTMEIVDPVTRRARTAGVALMGTARENPTVLRLANGEILVAGGLDANGKELTSLEWFAPDASRATKRQVDLVTGRDRAFVALGSGGALAVMRPPEGAPPDFKNVWLISAEGTLEPATTLDPTTLDTVRLFAGVEGAPALWTGRRWLRWSPWLGIFEPMAESPEPARGPTLAAIANGDPGLALWLDDRADAGLNVTGFRFSTRSRFDVVPKPLLVAGPDGLEPDRLAIRFDAARGLLLGPGASAFVSDLTFTDFDLELDITASAPMVVVRPERGAEIEVGGGTCAFGQDAARGLVVKRRGAKVLVAADGGAERPCTSTLDPDGRIAIGLRGAQGTGTSSARNLRITRR